MLSFTVSEINGEVIISGGLVNDPIHFENDSELMDLAYISCDEPMLRVYYTGYVWNTGDGDVELPSSDEVRTIRDLYEHLAQELYDSMDYVESGSYEVDNPYWEDEGV